MTNGILPENILADEVNKIDINGVEVRKGTVGAVLANIDLLEIDGIPSEQKDAALKTIESLVPSMIAMGLNKHVIWKNPKVQLLFDNQVQHVTMIK